MITYGEPLPGQELDALQGKLIVIEGGDASGRSTHAGKLATWLETKGHAVAQVGLSRSQLVAPELDAAKHGNELSPRPMALFYATDFFDQLENRIIPALRAGYVVLCDRYFYTLVARDLVRGGDKKWLRRIFEKAIVPHASILLEVGPEERARRRLAQHDTMDYWEAGMDLGLHRDWYESFMQYQTQLDEALMGLGKKYEFNVVDGTKAQDEVQSAIRKIVKRVLKG